MSAVTQNPNYCSCTVNQARNLLDKSKNGIDPFCIISMGKEKFVTDVREKTTSPAWHEQCDMPIGDDATIKLTVYHKNKSSLSKGDFIGRAYVSLRDLNDYDRVHTKWHKLTDKDGKLDKERGEIEVSLQFYSKNNTTGSVLDLATKKKHLSLKDIRRSLSDKFKVASKHRKNDQQTNENQVLADQRHGLAGDDGSAYNVRRFQDDSTSESASFVGSHTSLNSLPYNDAKKQKKQKSRAPSSGLGSTVGSGTPHSSHRSITSDYETSSILDSASMYGGEESSTTSPPILSRNHEQQQQIFVNDDRSSSHIPNKKIAKESLPLKVLPTTNTKTSSNPSSPLISKEVKRNTTVTSDDIEAAFDSINNNKKSINKSKDHEITSISTSSSVFGLSTIKENVDKDDNTLTYNPSKLLSDEEIDFSNICTKINQTDENKKSEHLTSDLHQLKLNHSSKEHQHKFHNQSDDIQTPSTSISIKPSTISSSSITVSNKKPINDMNDSTDEDVDELLGKFERISSMRSSVRRKIQPRDDIMQQSFSETDTKGIFGYNQTKSNQKTALPDIIGEPEAKKTSPYTTPVGPKKLVQNGLCVLGYANVKTTPINPATRHELDYLDREELLHVIAYQMELLKKRDTRVKDLEHYTDGLLVKIVDQCPNILQVGGSRKR